MKKKSFIVLIIVIILLIIGYLCLPFIEFRNNNKLYIFTRDDGFGEFEENQCYGENVSYNEKRNISINGWDIKELPLGIYLLILDYEEGNLCDYEYVLEEEYIIDVIENAEIIYNDNNIDLEELISGREAIVGNTKYLGNDYKLSMVYKLNDEEQELFIFYIDDLLIIQVGSFDDGARFIAYK